MDYHPNLIAGSLRSRKTKVIGLIVPDSSNALFADISRKIEELSSLAGYTIMLGNSSYNYDNEFKILKVLHSKRVDGLFIMPSTTNTEYFNSLSKWKLPFVIIHHFLPNIKADFVLLDNFRGTYDAVKYLLDLGHKRIGYIDRPYDLPHSLQRLDGYKKALGEAGIKYDTGLIVRGDFNYQGGFNAMKRLLNQRSIPTAVIAFNDVSAIGALKAIEDIGLNVPKDISLIGFDNISLCSFMTPQLTTINFPTDKMAETAVKILLEKINSPDVEKMIKKVLPLKLIIRESTSKISNRLI